MKKLFARSIALAMSCTLLLSACGNGSSSNGGSSNSGEAD